METKQTQETVTTASPILAGCCCLLTAATAELLLESSIISGNLVGGFGIIAVLFIVLFTIHRFALTCLPKYRPRVEDILCLHLVLIGSLLVVWFGGALAIGFATYTEKSHFIGRIAISSFQFAIPYAAGALLLQAILGIEYGFFFCLSFAVLLGVLGPEEPLMVGYVLTTTFVACLSLSRFRSRSAYLKAGLHVALVGLPFALVRAMVSPPLSGPDLVVMLVGPIVCGGLAAFIAAGFTPIFEYFGGYVTDLRLIEMATLDHPLLKDLSIQAPGTWNHSMVMGMLVEQGANAIGANPVLARVGAYFHDIGKMNKPLYFVENQRPGENRHDKLSTSMSALIIRSHVKDGIELAQEHKLPKAVQDMIPQHHGTSTIEYFYNKACKEAEEAGQDVESVDVSLYSYPGPKPQTREAGLLMLADGIEAAARTLNEPTLDRIQGMVQKMINKVFASGELDECDLTLQDLHQIAKCFTRVLNGIYHHRIAYDEPAEKVSEKEEAPGSEENSSAKELGHSGHQKKSRGPSEDDDTEEPDKENLKRLGLQ